MPPEKLSWKHLYDEVVTSGLCTGCAGCVIACPHDVLGYDDKAGVYKPLQIEEFGGPADCLARRQGLHVLHARLARGSATGSHDVDEFLFRPQAGGRGAQRHLQGHRSREGIGPGASTRSARTAGSSRPSSCTASRRHHRRGARVRTSRVTARRGRPSPASRRRRKTSSLRPEPLHLLGEPDGVRGSRRRWRGADRTRGHELPELDAYR